MLQCQSGQCSSRLFGSNRFILPACVPPCLHLQSDNGKLLLGSQGLKRLLARLIAAELCLIVSMLGLISLICSADQQEVWQPPQLQSISGQTGQTRPRIPHRPAPKKQQPGPLVRTFPPGSQGEPSLLIINFKGAVCSQPFSLWHASLCRGRVLYRAA